MKNEIQKFVDMYGCDYYTAKAYVTQRKLNSEIMEARLVILRNKINQEKKAKIANTIGVKKVK